MTEVAKLDLNLIVVLDALLNERNITRAGERAGMTQSAVSSALARLREIYDDPLLVREGRTFALTPTAEGLVPIINDCMREIWRTFEVLPRFDPATSTRTFLVAASDYVLSEITSPLLAVLAREAPGTRVQFDGLPVDAMLSPIDLLRRDVSISATGRGVPGKRTSLFSDQFVCLVDRNNPALRDGALGLDALAEMPFVRSVFGPHVSTHVDDMLGEAGVVPRAVITVQGFVPVPFAVAGTNWAGWVPERTARRFADGLGLVIAKTPVTPSVLVEAAHWHPSKRNDHALQWFIARLREASEIVEFGADDEATPED